MKTIYLIFSVKERIVYSKSYWPAQNNGSMCTSVSNQSCLDTDTHMLTHKDTEFVHKPAGPQSNILLA